MHKNARLSIPAPLRLPMASGMAFLVGLGLGTTKGSKMAGLRFRAEHAHKLPTTTTGWFLYHKSKNYHVAFGGLREGLRMGAKVCFWTTTMFSIEHMFDQSRGQKDFVNTVLACVTVAGGFSAWSTWLTDISFNLRGRRETNICQIDFRYRWRLGRQRLLSWSASYTEACKTLRALPEDDHSATSSLSRGG